jgi:Peptidase family M1 domain
MIRVRPSEFESRFAAATLKPRAVSGSDLRKANGFFEEYIGRTLQIDLTDLSRDRWSLVPVASDLIAEVRTRKFGNLTYARIGNDSEDVTLFDRKRRKNISVYASETKLAARGRFYSEDDLIDYDVINYDIESAFIPERLWISGIARLTLKIRAPVATTVTLRLADSLIVRSVNAPGFGRLLSLRVVGQNSLIVSLPGPTVQDTEFVLQIAYSGRVESQALENEAIAIDPQEQETFIVPAEPRYLYSNRSYWYPQATVTDYATARLRITVPPEFDVIASGTQTGPPAPAPGPVESGERPRKVYVFDSQRPVRYLACVISRFNTVTTTQLQIPTDAETSVGPNGARAGDDEMPENRGVSLIVQANPRQVGRARGIGERSAAVFQYYASLVGDAPYPSFTLAVSESDLPGGHSPGYFALLNQPLPTSQLVWRNDPVNFEQYPTFFLAHELAHQWWGQAVGWKNYHEQWLSEGFAQYFATLYAEKERGAEVAASVRRQMRRWAIEASPQGPIYLGYRLGHIKSDGRMRRALLYNKGAMVLHMLRRFVGDESFFGGLRKFYTDWRFRKAGTDDFRVAMESVSGRDLHPFFESWIYSSSIPRLKLEYEVAANQVAVKVSHVGTIIPVPVTVTLTYTSGETEDAVINVEETSVSRTFPLKGTLRDVTLNQDNGAVVEIER